MANNLTPGHESLPYHPDTNRSAPPAISSVVDLDLLPWGGNAWWDVPIIQHVERAMRDESVPIAHRMAVMARAGFLMTGDDCSFSSEQEFLDYMAGGAP